MEQGVDAQEYERQQVRLLDMLSNAAPTSAHVHSITVKGAQRTRDSFVLAALAPAFKARTFASVLNRVQEGAQNLTRLDIFDQLEITVDTPQDPFADRNEAVDIILNVKEKSRLCIKTGTEVGNGEGNMNGSITLRNIFGGAESLQAMASFGTRTSSAFSLLLATPLKSSPDHMFDFNAHSVVRNNMATSSHEEVARGLGIRLRSVDRALNGIHELSADSTWRCMDRIADAASLRQAGHSLKHSITHTFIRDLRNDPLLPTKGHYLRIANEFAGLGVVGDVHHWKTEVEASHSTEVGEQLALSTTFRVGLLYPFGEKLTLTTDRFQIGGPLSIRGLQTNGGGPRDSTDALGAEGYWSGGISVFAPIPKVTREKGWPVFLHGWLNAGTGVLSADRAKFSTESATDVPSNLPSIPASIIQSLTNTSPTVTAGLGLVYRHQIARIELNFCLPLQISRGDLVKCGWQLGLGMNFL
ncbi:hypothetical protein BZG36_01989 [Bifiguratus adelaidae]|uniref:POTRA domain-containing protein n=1 Tax=Bifiguratus adelaidae TaxID=1938954 RepID=A0A261Y448_9FUNG|nr:hypothetical protein BZG36_01989 [Bifiguratus adelaidae]